MDTKICKIVYFDEESTTDYVQIVAGGAMEKTEELLKSHANDAEASAKAGAKLGFNGIIKALIGLEATGEAGASGSISVQGSKIAKNIIKNTMLTDFLGIIEGEGSLGKAAAKSKRGAIKKFSGYSISVEPDSLSYMVMLAPYLGMLKTGSTIPAGDFNFALEKMDSALKNAKGYYEFVATKGRSKVVLRFNINSFRNGYKINYLLKMDLSIYAIKVGKTKLEMLNVSKELGTNFSIVPKDNPDFEEAHINTETDEKNKNAVLDVFDVLLAGVESDD